MKISAQVVDCFNYVDDLEENETIENHVELDLLIPYILSFNFYLRSPFDCPFARGNWVIDFYFYDGSLVSFKFPKDITEVRFKEFMQPLIDKIEVLKN